MTASPVETPELVERVARAIDPGAWERHDGLMRFAKEGSPGLPQDRHEASCQRLAAQAVERSLEQARAAIASLSDQTSGLRAENRRLRAFVEDVASGSIMSSHIAREEARKALSPSIGSGE